MSLLSSGLDSEFSLRQARLPSRTSVNPPTPDDVRINFGALSRSIREQTSEGQLPPISQNFATDVSEAPLEPDLLRLLTTLDAFNVPIENPEHLISERNEGVLGQGSFGTLEKATWRNTNVENQLVAIKKFNALDQVHADSQDAAAVTASVLHDFMFEVEIMCRCRHLNIAALLAVAFAETSPGDVENLRPCMVMECANIDTPDLASFCKHFQPHVPSDEVCFSLIDGIGRGLAALHSVGVVHADLKPENILMFRVDSSWIPKLCDFGLSGITTSQDQPQGGTALWKAPESLKVAKDIDGLQKYFSSPGIDVYAFGLIVGYIMGGKGDRIYSGVRDFNDYKLKSDGSMAALIWDLLPEAAHESQLGSFVRLILDQTLHLWPSERTTMLKINSDIIQSWRSSMAQTTAPANDVSVNDDFLTPFGASKLAQQWSYKDNHWVFAISHMVRYIKNTSLIPPSLSNAIARQLESQIKREGFAALPIAKKLATYWTLSSETRTALERQNPDMIECAKLWLKDDLFSLLGQDAMFQDFGQTGPPGPYLKRIHRIHCAAVRHLGSATPIPPLRSEYLRAQGSNNVELTGSSRAGLSQHLAAFIEPLDHCRNHWRHCWTTTPSLPPTWTPLHSAVLGGNTEVAKWLLSRGANVNAQLAPEEKFTLTPLMIAVLNNHLEMVQLLLANQHIDVTLCDSGFWGMNAVFYAAEFADDSTILKALLAHDPLMIESRDSRRRTPIHRAAVMARLEHIKLLLNAGANVNTVDSGGSTPLHRAYAAAGGYQGLQQMRPPDERVETKAFNVAEALPVLNATGNTLATLRDSLIPPHVQKGFANVVRQCPPSHDPFIQIWKGLNADMDKAYEGTITSLNLLSTILGPDIEQQVSYFTLDRRNERAEINLRKALECNEQSKEAIGQQLSSNQDDTTHLPHEPGREVIRLLKKHGADPEHVNQIGYTPECFAYRPQDLMWRLNLAFNCCSGYEPLDGFVESDRMQRQNDAGAKSLHTRPIRGDYSVWFWLDNILPNPHDAGVLLTLQRWPYGGSINLGDEQVVVDIQMHPTNNAGNSVQTLLCETFRLTDVVPSAGTAYTFLVGFAPIKHKCTLLVNIRSQNDKQDVTPPMAFISMVLESRPRVPLGTPIGTPSTTSWVGDLRQPFRTQLHSSPVSGFAPPAGTAFFHSKSESKKNPQKNDFATHVSAMRDAVEEADTEQASLFEPNPALYTRERLGPDGHGKMVYGPRVYWFAEDPEDGLTHEFMNYRADGLSRKAAMAKCKKSRRSGGSSGTGRLSKVLRLFGSSR